MTVRKEGLRRLDYEIVLALAEDEEEVMDNTGLLFRFTGLLFFRMGLLLNQKSVFPGAEWIVEHRCLLKLLL